MRQYHPISGKRATQMLKILKPGVSWQKKTRAHFWHTVAAMSHLVVQDCCATTKELKHRTIGTKEVAFAVNRSNTYKMLYGQVVTPTQASTHAMSAYLKHLEQRRLSHKSGKPSNSIDDKKKKKKKAKKVATKPVQQKPNASDSDSDTDTDIAETFEAPPSTTLKSALTTAAQIDYVEPM